MVENKVIEERRHTNNNLATNRVNRRKWSILIINFAKWPQTYWLYCDRLYNVVKVIESGPLCSFLITSNKHNWISAYSVPTGLLLQLKSGLRSIAGRSQSIFALVPTTGLLQDSMTEFTHNKDATLCTIDLYRPRFGVYKHSLNTLAISQKTDTDLVLSVDMTVCRKHALSTSSKGSLHS